VLSSYRQDIRQQAIALKRRYPHQGAEKIRLMLGAQRHLAASELPSASRLAVLFHTTCPEAVQVYRDQVYPATLPSAATAPHDLWEIDGQEKIPVGTTQVATVLNGRDVYSGVMLMSQAFLTTTENGWRKLTLAEVQNSLRAAFSEWGRPRALQTDREVVYVGAPERYFPSLFTLWLRGLGIEHRLSRPKRPTDQGAIEREHRTVQNWLWADTHFATCAALQSGLDDVNTFYNEAYPARTRHCHHQSPLLAHPQARFSGRPFHPAAEWQLFDMSRVDSYLAAQVWTRTASETGAVRLASQVYYLGRAFAGYTVSVTFQPSSRTFRFETDSGQFIVEKPTLGLDKADILGLTPVDQNWPVLAQPFQLPLPLVGV
jgi:transposase InsO family protein